MHKCGVDLKSRKPLLLRGLLRCYIDIYAPNHDTSMHRQIPDNQEDREDV